MRRVRYRGLRAATVALALVATIATTLVACSPDDRDGSTFDATVDPADCGLDALEAADGPVEILFWHTMIRSNAEWLEAATDEFNVEQDQVRVKLAQQPTYQDGFTKYKAGLQSKDLPDLVQMEETTMQQMIDSRSTVPVQACIDAADYDLSSFLPRALAYYEAGGVQRAMPWAISNPVLIYDKTKFAEAGLDPEQPPTTFAEVNEASSALIEAGVAKHGLSLKIAAYIYEFMLAKSGGEYVNNGNGREARASEANLDSDTSVAILEWWRDGVESGVILDTGSDDANIDHLLALTNGDAAMTIEGSSALGPVQEVLSSGDFGAIDLATGPLPSFDPSGGVPVGDGSLWLPKESDPEKRAAAWLFTEYLFQPEQVAGLAIAGGYIPSRSDATEVPELVTYWQENPAFRTAYDQLLAGPLNTSSTGSLIGEYQAVRDATRDALLRILQNGDDPAQAAEAAKAEADIAVQEYNDRVGG